MGGFVNETDNSSFDVVYVGTGAIGSLLFMISAALEGEYNGWRKLENLTTVQGLPNWMAYFGFVGSFLFLGAYLVDYNRMGSHNDELHIYATVNTFTVGSLFFLVSSWTPLWMWKK